MSRVRDRTAQPRNRAIVQAIIFPNHGRIPGHIFQSRSNGVAFRGNGVAFRSNRVRARSSGAGFHFNGVRCGNNGVTIPMMAVRKDFNGVAIRGNGARFHFNGADTCGNGVALQNNGFALKSSKTGLFPQISRIFADSASIGVICGFAPSTFNPQPLTNMADPTPISAPANGAMSQAFRCRDEAILGIPPKKNKNKMDIKNENNNIRTNINMVSVNMLFMHYNGGCRLPKRIYEHTA